MSSNFKFKVCLYKAYWEKGWGLTHYIKYFIAFFGLASRDVETTLTLGVLYFFLCFLLGWMWFKTGMINQELEVHNRVNEFVKEMREMNNRKV